MKTLYDAHGKKRLVEISAIDIVADTDYSWMLKDKTLSSKIIRMYFKIVRRTVLAGFDWTFPNGIKLSIRKQHKSGAHGLSRWLFDESGERKKVYNPRRPNEQYSIEMYGSVLTGIGYRFEKNSTFTKALCDRLFNTDTPYSTIAAK